MSIDKILEGNKQWAREVLENDPGFFQRLGQQQNPDFLWIGCSDSRVPANQIVNLLPGQVFVHRNIANLVQTSDLNCLSVIQYAVEHLQVKHVIVCGHYNCGGVHAAIENSSGGLIDYWIWNIKLIMKKHRDWLDKVATDKLENIVSEVNVIEQVLTLSHNRVIQDAWSNKSPLEIHGLIYAINDGILRNLDINCSGEDDALIVYQKAIEKIKFKYL